MHVTGCLWMVTAASGCARCGGLHLWQQLAVALCWDSLEHRMAARVVRACSSRCNTYICMLRLACLQKSFAGAAAFRACLYSCVHAPWSIVTPHLPNACRIEVAHVGHAHTCCQHAHVASRPSMRSHCCCMSDTQPRICGGLTRCTPPSDFGCGRCTPIAPGSAMCTRTHTSHTHVARVGMQVSERR